MRLGSTWVLSAKAAEIGGLSRFGLFTEALRRRIRVRVVGERIFFHSGDLQDLRLEAGAEHGPFGAIRWPAETDKQGRETVVPISPAVRDAVKRALAERAITAGYLFPMPTNPVKPISKDRATRWLRKAETLAELEHLVGGSWHPFRRGFATARKHLPLTDLAAAGGWKGTETLTRCYLHPDADTMLKVVLGGAELREVKQA